MSEIVAKTFFEEGVSICAEDRCSADTIRRSLWNHAAGIAELSNAEAIFVYVKALDEEKTLSLPDALRPRVHHTTNGHRDGLSRRRSYHRHRETTSGREGVGAARVIRKVRPVRLSEWSGRTGGMKTASCWSASVFGQCHDLCHNDSLAACRVSAEISRRL